MPAHHSPQWYYEKFKELAGELREARRKERRPNHLMIRATRASVQAARLVIEGVNAGVFNHRLSLREHLRFAWNGKFSGGKGTGGLDERGRLRFHLVAHTSEDDGAPFAVEMAPKEQLGRLWVFPIFTAVKSAAPSSFKPDAGAYDWLTTKKDDQGRLLGRDGKPLTYVAEKLIDPDTGDEVTRWELSAEPAYIGDDYDAADWLAHHRARVGDWADACSALADLVAVPTGQGAHATETHVPQLGDRVGGSSAESPPEPRVPARAKKAAEEYQLAAQAMDQSRPADREAYDHLVASMELSGEKNDLPQFDTWQRNLREHRRLTGQQKHKPRAGRANSARSVAQEHQI